MLVDLEKCGDLTGLRADICIIGAGAAGIVLALEQQRRGFKVLLLEAGGLGYEPRSQSLYSGEVAGLPFDGLLDGRMRRLGGTTNEWGGQIVEIDDHIFNKRSWIGGSGWPLEKAKLADYYERALAYEGLERTEFVDNTLADIQNVFGEAHLKITASRFCPKLNFFKQYEHELRNRADIVVVYHANVCEFRLDPTETSLQQVRCQTLTGRTAVFSATNFVLSVGGIETSRLLLQPKSAGMYPWQRTQQLGFHFQEHLVMPCAVLAGTFCDIGHKFDYFAQAGIKYHPKIKLTAQRQQQLQVLDMAATITPARSDGDRLGKAFAIYRLLKKKRFDRIDIQSLYLLAKALPELAWHRVPIARRRLSLARPSEYQLWVHTEQRPDSGSRISLSDETDQLGLRKVRIDWKIDELELQSIRIFTGEICAKLTNNGYSSVRVNPAFPDSDEMRANALESLHHMGGARMASDPSQGVVDPDLRVKGVHNFFVCSSAVFPSSGFANPTHTILALALRLSDTLQPN